MTEQPKKLTSLEVDFMLCGGNPNEQGISRAEQARRLRKLADLKDVEARTLREKADEVERGFGSKLHERLQEAVDGARTDG